MRELKYKKVDDNGYLITHRSKNFYIAQPPNGLGEFPSSAHDGAMQGFPPPVKIYTKAVKHEGRNADKIKNHPKARSNGFDKRPQDTKLGNAGQKIVKEKNKLRESGDLWRVSQRDCLKKMMSMETKELYAYLVKWGIMDKAMVFAKYGVMPTDAQVDLCDSSEPTALQTICINMVMEARNNAKFGMNILELLEGKAVSQLKVSEISQSSKDKDKGKAKPNDDIEEALEAIKAKVFDSGSNFDVEKDGINEELNEVQDGLDTESDGMGDGDNDESSADVVGTISDSSSDSAGKMSNEELLSMMAGD